MGRIGKKMKDEQILLNMVLIVIAILGLLGCVVQCDRANKILEGKICGEMRK